MCQLHVSDHSDPLIYRLYQNVSFSTLSYIVL